MALRNVGAHKLGGKYSPTFVTVANLDTTPVQVAPFTFMIVGNVCHVAGQVTIDPTAAALSRFRISLPPIAKVNIAAAGEVAGLASNEIMLGDVIGDATNDNAEARVTAPNGTADVINVQFQYAVR